MNKYEVAGDSSNARQMLTFGFQEHLITATVITNSQSMRSLLKIWSRVYSIPLTALQ